MVNFIQSTIKPLERSILIVNFTVKETGLIGSELFARVDIPPTKHRVGLLNIDGINALDGVDYVLQYGKDMSKMEDYLVKAAKQAVPSLLFMSLGDPDPDYMAHKYHKEEDDYSESWSLGGVKQDILLMVDIANQLVTNKDWPKWKADSDFKKRRLEDKKLED